ncbi:MAG: L-asparaginase [Verrucomicrobia bacterium]|jgi:L-asparaginase|nr:MAG: L-asparaginase [Verrucomicrobiota bacterium]
MKTERVEPLLFVTCGGTIDKVYFDAKSEFEVGSPQVAGLLEEANVSVPCRILPVLRKDSLEMTEADREAIREAIAAQPERLVVVTHGTDTMIQTARVLSGLEGRTIVLTGSMQPARFRVSDAEFNLGTAVAAVQLLPSGVYVAMNGRVFDPARARKNVEANRFEEA